MVNVEKFLIEAKKQTYANEKVEKVANTRQNSKDYEYKKDKMVYHDTYFGGTKFIGEEVVYVDRARYATEDELIRLAQFVGIDLTNYENMGKSR